MTLTRSNPDRLVYDQDEKEYVPAVEHPLRPREESEMWQYWQQRNHQTGDTPDA